MTHTRDEVLVLLRQYNKEPFHILHALTVEGVMTWYARELGYGQEADFWSMAGLLHDIDFEQWPEEHCRKGGGGPRLPRRHRAAADGPHRLRPPPQGPADRAGAESRRHGTGPAGILKERNQRSPPPAPACGPRSPSPCSTVSPWDDAFF